MFLGVFSSARHSRQQQLVDWCGGPNFDGCLIFDECHKAKHFVPVNIYIYCHRLIPDYCLFNVVSVSRLLHSILWSLMIIICVVPRAYTDF